MYIGAYRAVDTGGIVLGSTTYNPAVLLFAITTLSPDESQ